MFWVYMLECADGSLYTGWTKELEKRVTHHNVGRGSKYVRSRLPARLVYAESLASKSEAMHRECALKKLTRAEKMALIAAQKSGQADECCGCSERLYNPSVARFYRGGSSRAEIRCCARHDFLI
jgi:putative endonuclease